MADFPAPKPFYRSRLFWLGLPGLVFLLWAGLGFSGRAVDAGMRVHYYDINLAVSDGYLAAQYFDFTPIRHKQGSSPWVWRLEERIGESYSGSVFRVYPLSYNGEPGAITSYALEARFWFLTLLYLIAWFGILAAWQRRKARLLKATATLLP